MPRSMARELEVRRDPTYRAKKAEIARRWRRLHPKSWRSRKTGLVSATPWKTVVRQFIRERDGDLCWVCGHYLVPGTETIDHVIPLVQHGPTTSTNLRLACRSCNLTRPRGGRKMVPTGVGVLEELR